MPYTHLDDLLTPELAAGERLLWTGRPPRGLLLRQSDFALIPFSLIWTAFAFFWESQALRSGPLLAKLWGLPFVAIGLYLIVGRFFHDALWRARTSYALTDRRALIVTDLWPRKVRSVPLSIAPALELEVGADGVGTIYFGPKPPSTGKQADTTGHGEPPRFERIPDVRQVHNLIVEIQHTARTRPANFDDRPPSTCVHCGYDLRGQTDPRCPECGRSFDPTLLLSHGKAGGKPG
jgi:hypothetical protein